MSEYLFDNLSMLAEKIDGAKSIVIFLDYDGTLVGFTDNPMDAVPTNRVLEILKKLIDDPRIHPIIVTGRNPGPIKSLIPLKGLEFVSSHGYVMDFPDFKIDIPQEDKVILDKIFTDIMKEFSGKIPRLNKKGDYGINFNYRPYKGYHEKVIKKFLEITKQYDTQGKFRIVYLSKCINLIPRIWNKGKAIEYIIEKHYPDSLQVYFGDDTSDEDAFEVLKNKGITVYVKNDDQRGTKAQFFVNDPNDVLKALEKMFNKEIQTNS